MKKRRVLLTGLSVWLLLSFVQGQTDSILQNGVYRNYILHLPANYSTAKRYPLVVSMHGFTSNAQQQQLYSQFDKVSDSAGFVVAYPNALGGRWDLTGNTDVDFITNLADTLRSRYSINNCLFACGMSMGGFMSYKLACTVPQKLTAIGVVSGNITTTIQAACAESSGVPVLHFHGTADAVVYYNGQLGMPPIETTVNWWVTKNGCNLTPVKTAIPNINTTDNSTVELWDYGTGTNGSTVNFYKITNGGHTWPGGAADVLSFGNTNRDISASSLLWLFFSRFCTAQNEFRWNGTVSDEWENTANWDSGKLPGSYSTVIVPSTAPHFPKLSSSTSINRLELRPGSSVIVGNGITLVVESR